MQTAPISGGHWTQTSTWALIRWQNQAGLVLQASVPWVTAPEAPGSAHPGDAGHGSLCLLPMLSTCAAPGPQTLPVWRSWDTLQASQHQPLCISGMKQESGTTAGGEPTQHRAAA